MPKTTSQVSYSSKTDTTFNVGDLVINERNVIVMSTGNQNDTMFTGTIMKEGIDSSQIGTFLPALSKSKFKQFYGEITLKSQ